MEIRVHLDDGHLYTKCFLLYIKKPLSSRVKKLNNLTWSWISTKILFSNFFYFLITDIVFVFLFGFWNKKARIDSTPRYMVLSFPKIDIIQIFFLQMFSLSPLWHVGFNLPCFRSFVPFFAADPIYLKRKDLS